MTVPELVADSTDMAVAENRGHPVTMEAILDKIGSPVGYERDFRQAVARLTTVVGWTEYGIPLRLSDQGDLKGRESDFEIRDLES